MSKRSTPVWPIMASLFLVLFLLSISLHIWDLKPWGKIIDYQKSGSWGDLISGIGTLAAALVAYWGIYLESRRARAAEEAIERRLNTQIFCWLEPRETGDSRDWLLCFENNTGIPIYNWSVTLVGKEKTISSTDFGPLRPKSSQLRIEELSGMQHVSIPPIRLTFTDPVGLTWTRTEEGKLLQEASSIAVQSN